MNRRQFTVCLLGAAAIAAPAMAQVGERRRNQGSGGGQPLDSFKVVSVDADARTIQLQAGDGSTSKVKVPDGVYDLDKLKPGDRIQVNFYVPDSMNPGLRAAAIYPVQ